MTTPFYLQAPAGDEQQVGFLDRLGERATTMWDQTPPEAFFALASAFAKPRGGTFGMRLAEGLTGVGQAVQQDKKRKGLASAFDSILPTIPEEQRPMLSELVKNNPEAVIQAYVGQLFSKPAADTSDIKNYEYAVKQGYKGTLTEFRNQFALAGAGVAPIPVPGVGIVDPKTGNVTGTPAPSPSAPPPPSSNAPTIPPGMKGFEPEEHPELYMADQPQPAKREPILEPQAKMLNLGAPGQGQRWVWGDNAQPMLEDVPGFKAAPTALPAEIGARIGLAEGFLKRYDTIYKKMPELESVLGRGQVLFNTGVGAEVKRHIETGAEALIRSLTGAGKSKEEAESYASRYLPSPFDTAFDLKSKLEGLRYDLENSIQGTMKDKGGWKSPAKDPIKAIPLPLSPLQLKNDGKTIYQTKNGPAYFIGNGKFRSAE